MEGTQRTPGPDWVSQRCAHCGLPFPKQPLLEEIDGSVRRFCSKLCRDGYRDHHLESPINHGLKRVSTGVSGLDAQLPDGLPRNAFVIVTSFLGTRWEALFAELAWRTLQRGEPVIVVAYREPPVSLVQQLLTLQWNVLPYLEDGQFHIVDCFTYRVSSYDHVVDRFTDWNSYLYEAIDGATTRLTEPNDTEAVYSAIDDVAEQVGMRDRGIILIDSLYELGTLTQPVHAQNFIKDLRADLSKGRFVPVFGGVSMTVDESAFPRTMMYLVDGVIELTLRDDGPGPDYRKYVRVPGVQGVTTYPRWIEFEYEPANGMVLLGSPDEAGPVPQDYSDTDTNSGEYGRHSSAW